METVFLILMSLQPQWRAPWSVADDDVSRPPYSGSSPQRATRLMAHSTVRIRMEMAFLSSASLRGRFMANKRRVNHALTPRLMVHEVEEPTAIQAARRAANDAGVGRGRSQRVL
jgi:hypothetical protein